ncbi:transposase, partial [Arsenophonus sp. ENCA]|uniref:transposase n=1 Tax=Arsenophonus sp. ENCA TaxID=1987579 RepID=UPI0025C4BF4D
ILNQRKSMVEPVFSALRGIQGLERFRRKGLLAVKLEFTLHAMAYNLSRAVALILWMIFSLLFVQTKIRKRENLHGGILLKKKIPPLLRQPLQRGCGYH